MRSIIAAAALSLALCASAKADSKKMLNEEHPTPEKMQEHAFASWFFETAKSAELSPEIASLIWGARQSEERTLSDLAHHISRFDPATRRYLFRVEELFKKNERLNPYDEKLLSRMRSAASEKRELADRLDRLCEQAGVPKGKEVQWQDSLSQVPDSGDPKTGALRYDVDTGLWERYDGKKRAWERFTP